NRACIERCRIGIDAAANWPDIGDEHSDQQGDCGSDFEIDQRLDADIGDLAHIADRRDTNDDGQEYDRCDDELDRADEHVAKRLEHHAELRLEIADHGSDNHADDDLHVQLAEPGSCKALFWGVVDCICLHHFLLPENDCFNSLSFLDPDPATSIQHRLY